MIGSQDRRSIGFPVGSVAGSDWQYVPNFGGLGTKPDSGPSPWRYIYWPIKVSPFSVLNKKLILMCEDFKVYSDSGRTIQANYTLIISDRPPTDDAVSSDQILSSIDVPASTILPIQFEFDQMISDKTILPQPNMSTYDRNIYAIVDCLQTGQYLGATEQIIEAMKTVSLQFEGTP